MQDGKSGLENGSCFCGSKTSESFNEGSGVAQPSENFANLDPINASVLSFWRLKKTNLQGCTKEN